jgi:hypothetical protein
MTMTGALYLDWLDLVHTPVFVLDIDQSVLLRANESLRRILPKGRPEPPAPLADFIGAGAAGLHHRLHKGHGRGRFPQYAERDLPDCQRHGESHPPP